MFNKTNNQTHNGNGNQYIDQSMENNFFITYGESSNNSSNDEFLTYLICIPVIIFLCLGNFMLGIFKAYQPVLISSQIILLVTSNLYVYLKSKDLKLLITEIIPSILSIGTTLFSINYKTPNNIQIILDKLNTNPDTHSIQTIIDSLTDSLPKIWNVLFEYSWWNIVTLLYLIVILLVIISPIIITFNVIIKKSIKNKFTYFVTIFYWMIFFGLKFFQIK